MNKNGFFEAHVVRDTENYDFGRRVGDVELAIRDQWSAELTKLTRKGERQERSRGRSGRRAVGVEECDY
jgi:hypothetical protein